MAGAEDLSIQIKYERGDMYRGYYLWTFRRKNYWLLLAGCFLVPTVIHNAFDPLGSDGWAGTMGATVILVAFGSWMPMVAARIAIKFPSTLSPMVYRFSDRGVRIEQANLRLEIDWPLTTGGFESSKYIFMTTLWPQAIFFMPKRQITDGQMDRLKDILRRHIATNLSLRP
jgi:hypothetical protein